MLKQTVLKVVSYVALMVFSGVAFCAPSTKGIYINQGTLEDTKRLTYLIDESKKVGINTFVVDMEKPTRNYQKNINLIKDNGIAYVARVVVFPDGGDAKKLKSTAYWEGRLKLVEKALEFGADEIQLDYIRYSTKQPPSEQNAKDVKEVIKFFKEKVAAKGKPLQIDIFGEVSFKESPRIGQNVQLFADTIDVVCPMVYPSHYHPYQKHSAEPYNTVYKSLTALKSKFDTMPFKLTPYIEASNYHYKWSDAKKAAYLNSQIKAVEDANADGWFVWSPQNHYDNLFATLKTRADKTVAKAESEKHFSEDGKVLAKAESNSKTAAEKANATTTIAENDSKAITDKASTKTAKAEGPAKAVKVKKWYGKPTKNGNHSKGINIKTSANTARAESNSKVKTQ